MRVAAVDIGSNAIRFAAAEMTEGGRRVDLAYRRLPIRLGRAAFEEGELSREDLNAAAAGIAGFAAEMDDLGVRRHRAVATSAVRESRNGQELVERVADAAGVRIEAIDGREEARLVWVAARRLVPVDGPWLLADLGGGSLEVSLVRTGAIEWTRSLPLGTVRLLGTVRGDEQELGRVLDEALAGLEIPPDARPLGMIGAGGNIEALAELAGAAAAGSTLSRFAVADLHTTEERLNDLSVDQRMERLGLRPDRADVIVPAAAVYGRVAALAGASEILVPHVGLLDGILLELA